MSKIAYVYILTNKPKGVLYIGVTNHLERRLFEHHNKQVASFSQKYNLDKLVWYQQYASVEEAISDEKRFKSWNRQWKVDLIEKNNTEWLDLFLNLNQ